MRMKYLEKILVPVDFSANTAVAIAKATELSLPGITVIELVHVTESIGPAEKKFEQLLRDIAADPGIRVSTHVIKSGRVEASLVAYAGSSNPCMIVIAKNNYHSFFPFLNTIIPASIAAETKCPVLTVKPGSGNRRMETVVMPLSEYFPSKKIDLLATLSAKLNLSVHLLSVLDSSQHPDSHSASALLHSMKQVREKLKCNVQHCTVHSDNKAIATLRYAENVDADVLLVSPETETSITTWMSKKDITGMTSQFQVLSIQPD
jgi:nucleotide-binding universal stress UspA family protein